MEAITKAAHEEGIIAGFDLAHAIGNVELRLHDWKADFACWCSYKYLNSSPGGISGIYINEKYVKETSLKKLPRFAGWWGYNKTTRFKMARGFDAIPTAESWQLSNSPILILAAHKASLDIFEAAGMDRLHAKRKMLAAYIRFILDKIIADKGSEVTEVITPANENERGCQVSILMHQRGGKHSMHSPSTALLPIGANRMLSALRLFLCTTGLWISGSLARSLKLCFQNKHLC